MTNTTGPARLRQIAEFTILSAVELRQLAAQWEADCAALAEKTRVSDKLVEVIAIDEEHCAELDAARAALEQLQDALSVRDHQYLAARAEIVAQRVALERARALVRILRIASDDPRASYETSRAYERAANDLEAALGVAPVSAQTCQECGHLESEHRSVAGGLGFACRHAGCDCIKQAAASGGAA